MVQTGRQTLSLGVKGKWGGGQQRSGLDGQHHAPGSKPWCQSLNSPKYSSGSRWLGHQRQARVTTKCSGDTGWEDNARRRALLPPRCSRDWADSPTGVPEGARRCPTCPRPLATACWAFPPGLDEPLPLYLQTQSRGTGPLASRGPASSPAHSLAALAHLAHLACYLRCPWGFQSLWDTPVSPGLPNSSTEEHTPTSLKPPPLPAPPAPTPNQHGPPWHPLFREKAGTLSWVPRYTWVCLLTMKLNSLSSPKLLSFLYLFLTHR